MTVQQLLEKARENGKKRNYENYLKICDGNIKETEEFIEFEKTEGTFQRAEETAIMDSIFDVIQTIRKTSLMTEEQKEKVINEIHQCPEYEKLTKRVVRTFTNHFVKYKDVYLR